MISNHNEPAAAYSHAFLFKKSREFLKTIKDNTII